MPARKSSKKSVDGVKRAAGEIEKTPDGRYIVVDGRRWRTSNPNLSEGERTRLVGELMKARRDVGRALREKNEEDEREARRRVHEAKVALGERGPKWWEKEE